MARRSRCLATGLGLLMPAAVQAQLPLSIEELLVEQQVTKLQASVRFHHSEQGAVLQSSHAGGGTLLRTSGVRQRETTGALRLRHGIARHLELHLGATRSRHSLEGLSGWRGQDTWRVSTGANWLVSPDNHTPALLLQGSLDIAEQGGMPGESSEWGHTARLGATAYRAIDPLVLSMSVQYQHSQSRDTDLGSYRPGAQWALNPQVNFAVNYRVTLVGGVTLQHRETGTMDGSDFNPSGYQTALNLGLGLLVGRHSTLFAETRIATSGGEGAALMLDWLYQF